MPKTSMITTAFSHCSDISSLLGGGLLLGSAEWGPNRAAELVSQRAVAQARQKYAGDAILFGVFPQDSGEFQNELGCCDLTPPRW